VEVPARVRAGENHLGGELLRSVSRSFYLSVRLLPRRLREPVGLAYLLARATDTLADSTEVPTSIRRETLAMLASAIQEGNRRDAILDLRRSFALLQKDEAERNLILLLSQCLDRLDQLDEPDRAEIRVVLSKISRAQSLDLERFADPAKIAALASEAALREYAYLIAGCVGEFWTELCFRHVENFAGLSGAEMRALGKSYGVGLQLVNIVRDAHGDLRAGRCYFPSDELSASGLAPSDILGNPAVFKPILEKWLTEAEEGLQAGMKYVDAIRDRRVRMATALPALIGARTITRLRAAGARALQEKIKVPRNEVRGMLASVAITLGSRSVLSEMFRRGLK
jgi:farnesyl-diphosphate farnesyltransferase